MNIYNADTGAKVTNTDGDVWFQAGDLADLTFTSPAAGETSQQWINMWMGGETSGWEDAVITGAAEEVGETYTLTTDLDDITGTANADTVNGILSDGTDETTWAIADTIDGGEGTDTMNVSVIDSTGAISSYAGRTTSNVEIFNLKYIDGQTAANGASVNVSGFDGATQVWVKGSTVSNSTDDTFDVTGVADGTTLGLANNDTDLDVNFTTDGTDGSGDSVSLAVGGGKTGDVVIDDGAGDGYATVAVATSGSAGTLAS